MASGNSPYDVDGTPIFRLLEQQNAWSLGVIRVILNNLSVLHTLYKFPCKQSVTGYLVVSVLRDSHTALGDQGPNSVKGANQNCRRCR